MLTFTSSTRTALPDASSSSGHWREVELSNPREASVAKKWPPVESNHVICVQLTGQLVGAENGFTTSKLRFLPVIYCNSMQTGGHTIYRIVHLLLCNHIP